MKKKRILITDICNPVQDGNKKEVRVEVIGVLDRATRNIRLRASEPITASPTGVRYVYLLTPTGVRYVYLLLQV